MSWQERVRELKFIAPSGKEHRVNFSDLERTGGKKAPVTEFPGQNQGSVQNLGNITPTWPIQCWVSGPDYDKSADAFWEALHEDGTGTLNHPVYGTWQVMAVPKSERRDFVDGAGRAVFSVTFIRVSEEQFQYPNSTPDFQALSTEAADKVARQAVAEVSESLGEGGNLGRGAVQAAAGASKVLGEGGNLGRGAVQAAAEVSESLGEGAVQAVAGASKVLSEKEKMGAKAVAAMAVNSTVEAFKKIEGLSDEARQLVDRTAREIIEGIDSLASAPASLMQSMLDLYRIPGQIKTNIESKIDAYRNLYKNLIKGFRESTENYGGSTGAISAGNAAGILAAANEASQYGTFSTRNQAISGLEALLALNQEEDAGQEAKANRKADPIEKSYTLQKAVDRSTTIALRGIVQQSLNLPAEKKFTTESDICPLKLLFELGTSMTIDEFINYSGIGGGDVFIIPKGREVRYHA